MAVALFLVLAMALAGCASTRLHQEGVTLLQQGHEEEGIAKLEAALQKEPDSVQIRADLINARRHATERLLRAARQAHATGRDDEAMAQYQRVLTIDGRNAAAVAGMLQIERGKRHAEMIEKARDLDNKGEHDAAVPLLRAVLTEDPNNTQASALLAGINEQRLAEIRATPVLKPKLARRVSLEFQDAKLKVVFDALSRTTGVNFMLDKDVKTDNKVSLVLRDVHVEDAIELITMQNQLSRKILSENSVLIYPPQKNNEYQDLVIKSFYLDNAKVKQTVDLLRTVLKTKDLYVDESINLVVMRDTPEAIRLAEKLVKAHDMAEPEVMLEIEVLEINRSRLLELGVQWTDQVSFGVIDSNGPPLTLDDLKGINSGRISVTSPTITATARKTDGDSNTLLNPHIRVRNREKANVVVADRLPVISSVVTSGTGNPVISDSIQYLDVGLKLEVQPTVTLDNRVSINVNLEVSNLGEEVRTPNGSVAYRVGTRNAQTVLSIADGETQILSGVISNADRKAATKLPGLGDLPLVGRLFGGHSDQTQNTEILLSITPRIVSNVVRPQADIAEFWSGSEATLRTRPLALRSIAVEPAAEGARPVTATVTGNGNATQTGAAPDAEAAAIVAQPLPPETLAPDMPAPARGQVTAAFEGPTQISVGATFKVVLWVNSIDPVNAMAAQIGFDAAALEVVEVEQGNFLSKDGVLTTFTQRIDPAGKVVVRNVRRVAASGVTGAGPLATVTFRAREVNPAAQIELQNLVSLDVGNQSLALVPSNPLGVALIP